jgi:O-methyltransferase domain
MREVGELDRPAPISSTRKVACFLPLAVQVLQELESESCELFRQRARVEAGYQRLAKAQFARRCSVVGGSFFDSVPTGGDCYLLKFVILDWDDERAAQILRNVRTAMIDDGRILLLEFVIPPGNEHHQSKLMDLSMLVFTEGGRVRTEAEHRRLLQSAGCDLTRVIPTQSTIAILEAASA